MTMHYTPRISRNEGAGTASVIRQQLGAAPDTPTVIAESVTESAGTSTVAVIGPRPYLTAEQYPALAKIWDNEEDDIFDTL